MATDTRPSRQSLEQAPEQVRRQFSLLRREGSWKDALRRRMLALADVASAFLAAAALGLVEGSVSATIWAAALVPVWVLLAKARGLYEADHVRIRHQTIDEISNLFDWVTMSVAVTAVTLALGNESLLSASAMVAMWITGFVAAFVLRGTARYIWRWVVPAERGLLVGEGALADAMARKLSLEHGHHLTITGKVSLEDGGFEPSDRLTISLDSLPGLIADQGVERVVLALHDLDEGTLSRVTATCRSMGVKLSVAPPLRAMLGTAVELTHLAELPLIEFRTWDPSRSTMLLKRLVDIVGATVALSIVSPLLVAISVWIRLDSEGPAFYRQRRAGQEGRPFWMLKFRTMVEDADSRVDEVVRIDALVDPMFKLRHDPRVTRAGRFLRRWSLDELPQVVNVLKGEMSLVGPRPEEVWLVERYGEAERFRLEMKPGLTGPMQVHGRGELTFQERAAVEREYVENYSIRKDVQILFRTASAVLRGKGAF